MPLMRFRAQLDVFICVLLFGIVTLVILLAIHIGFRFYSYLCTGNIDQSHVQ